MLKAKTRLKASEFPKIKDNKILYSTHLVVCDPSQATPTYLKQMMGKLSPYGSMHQHKHEINALKVDGVWSAAGYA